VNMVPHHQVPVALEGKTLFLQVMPGSRRCDASFELASNVSKRSEPVHVPSPQLFGMSEESDVGSQSKDIKSVLHLASRS
jgi:hypothetical protein